MITAEDDLSENLGNSDEVQGGDIEVEITENSNMG